MKIQAKLFNKINNKIQDNKQTFQILSLIRKARYLTDRQIKEILLKNSILLSVQNIKNYAGIQEKKYIYTIKNYNSYNKINNYNNNSIINIKI
jgi:hypothetical protein